MKRLIHALSDMPVVKLKGDRDAIQVGARRAVMARLCTVIQGSRHGVDEPRQGRRLFTRDEAIALGTLFILAMREVGMGGVMAGSEELASGLQHRLVDEPANRAQPDGDTTEDDVIDAAEKLSNGLVGRLEYATGELW
jgi:hypothetical protein